MNNFSLFLLFIHFQWIIEQPFRDVENLIVFFVSFWCSFHPWFRNENASESIDSKTLLEKKKYDDEIARLRGENELLKAILIKNGINYVKERTSFKSNEYS